MPTNFLDALHIGGDSAAAAVGASSAALQIPALQGGTPSDPNPLYATADPRFVAVTNVGTDDVFVRPGDASITVTVTNGIPIQAGQRAEILNVSGCTHLAHIGATGGASNIHVTPLANQ